MDLKEQYFGTEIEMTGITREEAANAVGELFGTQPYYIGTYYSTWGVRDLEGKEWKFTYDGSIHTQRRNGNRYVYADSEYSTEMVSPKLEYGEMEKLQQVVRCLRSHGGKVNSSCGMHVHVDASNHTPRSLKNALTIMYSKEDILFKALQVNPSRVEQWCKKVRENVLEDIRKMPSGNMSMDKFRQLWYEERRMGGRSHSHYDDTRYYALNLHAVFDKGTVEWRCFNSTLHAGKVRANITLALAISAQAINQKCTHMRKTEISENPCFTFRTFLLRLGLIGPEYKNVRKHLLDHLEGDKAWRYDKNTEYFVKKVDYQDLESIQLACMLHKETLKETYDLESILQQYEEEAKNREEKSKEEKIREESKREKDRREMEENQNIEIQENSYYNKARENYAVMEEKRYGPIKKFAKRFKSGKWGEWEDLITEADDYE